jgi:hypothetical protein
VTDEPSLGMQVMLRHALHKAIMVSAGLVTSNRGNLFIGMTKDAQLADRAVGLILRSMLRELVSKDDPKPADFQRLLDEIAALAHES